MAPFVTLCAVREGAGEGVPRAQIISGKFCPNNRMVEKRWGAQIISGKLRCTLSGGGMGSSAPK